MFLHGATVRAYSLRSLKFRPFHERVEDWLLHFIGFISIMALAAVYIRQKMIDSNALFVSCLYIGTNILGNLAAKFFVNPLKAYLFMMLVFIAILNGVVGSIREINEITNSKGGPAVRILRFSGASYSEPDWRVLAITQGFVILRRQTDGSIRVFAKSDLKSIENVIGEPTHRTQG